MSSQSRATIPPAIPRRFHRRTRADPPPDPADPPPDPPLPTVTTVPPGPPIAPPATPVPRLAVRTGRVAGARCTTPPRGAEAEAETGTSRDHR